jgi:hypothetical protein
METWLRPYDIGCEPSPSVPAESLLQDGWKTYLLFFAVSKSVDESGYLTQLGVAVVDCRDCLISKFGDPNDEGRPEHPLYHCGMAATKTSILEVIESPWAREVSEQKAASARRIWGGRSIEMAPSKDSPRRHFIVTLKEKTFECIASSLTVKRFFKTFDEAYAHVIGKLQEH